MSKKNIFSPCPLRLRGSIVTKNLHAKSTEIFQQFKEKNLLVLYGGSMKRFGSALFALLLFCTVIFSQIKSPDDFLNFPLGADRKLVDYHQIVDYFSLLDQNSPKLLTYNLGKTTDGNDMMIAVISSEKNIINLDKYKNISRQLAHPGDLTSDEAENLIQQGKVIAFITCNIHSTEIGASQMAMEFAHQLITSSDPKIKFYLDNVILILMPSANPDGQLMVCDWYRQWVGTEYEGGSMPWLYHRYVGHDTNRDFFMLNLKESKMINHVMSQEWFPQVHLDEHQMGSRGPRMFVPPYKDPMSPNLSPLLLRLEALYGTNMSYRLEEKGFAGVIDTWAFDSYWPGGTRTAAWKNIVSLLTEMASCDIATPIFIEENELSGGRKGLVNYKQQINFPNPWLGGWWRLRDIIDYELTASFAFLETSAKFREGILRGFCTMNLNAIEDGKQKTPFAYIFPKTQHDAITVARLIDILLQHGVEVYQTEEDIILNNQIFRQGSILVPLAQPLRAFICEMLDIQEFPEIRLSEDGEPLYPYDVTAWSLPLMMGANCQKIEQPHNFKVIRITTAPFPKGEVTGTSNFGYAISHQYNNASLAINRLLKAKLPVYVAKNSYQEGEKNFDAGTIILPATMNMTENLQRIAADLHLKIHPLNNAIPNEIYELKPVRLGMYKPYRASMDEGWTRFLLEQYEFDLTSLFNENFKNSKQLDKFDVILIPDIDRETIIDPKPKDKQAAKFYRPLPEKYEGGIGIEGVDNLRTYVRNGGTLITWDSGCMLPIEEFPLPVVNVVENVNRRDFNAPGVLLKVKLIPDHPICWGMPETFSAFVSNSPAFRTSAPTGDIDRKVVAYYPDESLLLSGWIQGEVLLRKKAAIVEIKYGNGKVVLIGFRAQHRAQPHATFKLLFNAIQYAGIK